jgi:hypothetical protein
MNWMRHKIRHQLRRVLLLGGAAGLWAAFLAEGTLLLAERWEVGWLRALLPLFVLGTVFGALFASIGEYLNRHFHRALGAAVIGALLTGGAGVLSHLLIVLIAQSSVDPAATGAAGAAHSALVRPLWLGVNLAIVAAAAALASSLGRLHWRQGLRRATRALVPGAALGALPGALPWENNSWVLLVGMGLWGALLALAVFWLEQRLAQQWLRVLIGPGEDRFFPLDRRRITLGKEEANDIPLLEGQEVYPHHCEIKWMHDHYEIIDDEQGGVVLVNFRQIQEHALRPGDLVKIGSVLLQYGEGTRP